MVFATDFDPYSASERTAEMARQRHAISGLENTSDGSDSATEQKGLIKDNLVKDNLVKDNVVPLRVGAPAARVRLENKSLLLPRQPKLPLGLQVLHRLQQGSALVMGVLVTGALAVYGSTVYVDKSTSRALVQLDELQGESQQLTSANESIKQSLAEQAAQAGSGLEPYEADDVILLTPAPRRAGAAPEEPVPELPGPLGY